MSGATVVVESYQTSGVPLAAGRILIEGPYVRGGFEVDLRRFIGDLRGISVAPAKGYVFAFDHDTRRLKVMQVSGRGPLTEVPTGTDMTGVAARFLAWGAF